MIPKRLQNTVSALASVVFSESQGDKTDTQRADFCGQNANQKNDHNGDETKSCENLTEQPTEPSNAKLTNTQSELNLEPEESEEIILDDRITSSFGDSLSSTPGSGYVTPWSGPEPQTITASRTESVGPIDTSTPLESFSCDSEATAIEKYLVTNEPVSPASLRDKLNETAYLLLSAVKPLNSRINKRQTDNKTALDLKSDGEAFEYVKPETSSHNSKDFDGSSGLDGFDKLGLSSTADNLPGHVGLSSAAADTAALETKDGDTTDTVKTCTSTHTNTSTDNATSRDSIKNTDDYSSIPTKNQVSQSAQLIIYGLSQLGTDQQLGQTLTLHAYSRLLTDVVSELEEDSVKHSGKRLSDCPEFWEFTTALGLTINGQTNKDGLEGSTVHIPSHSKSATNTNAVSAFSSTPFYQPQNNIELFIVSLVNKTARFLKRIAPYFLSFISAIFLYISKIEQQHHYISRRTTKSLAVTRSAASRLSKSWVGVKISAFLKGIVMAGLMGLLQALVIVLVAWKKQETFEREFTVDKMKKKTKT